jgi:hypothetical protein
MKIMMTMVMIINDNNSNNITVKLFLCLIKHYAMNTYRGVEV